MQKDKRNPAHSDAFEDGGKKKRRRISKTLEAHYDETMAPTLIRSTWAVEEAKNILPLRRVFSVFINVSLTCTKLEDLEEKIIRESEWL